MSEPKNNLFLDPMSDIFTATLWSAPKNEHLLRSFINGVRTDAGMTPIVQATVLNPFNIKEFVASKGIILDVRAKDEHNLMYDIEVQTSNHPAFPNRILDYWSETFVAQLKSGLDYTELRQVISIILTSFPIFRQLENIHNIFQITAKEDPSFVLTDAFQMHFLRIAEVNEQNAHKLACLCRDLRDWVLFFAYGGKLTEAEMSNLTDNNPIILEAYQEMQRFYANPETHEKALAHRRFIIDYNLGMSSSKAEGLAEGLAVGKAVGRAEGKSEDIKHILNRRFNVIPDHLENKLNSLSDIVELKRLFDLALDCDSLEEFELSAGIE